MRTRAFALPILLASMLATGLHAAQRSEADASTPTPGNLTNGKESPFVARTQKPLSLVFFGDSITNDWPDKSPETWKLFAPYDVADFGISGEGTENVLWRIEHGDLENYKAKAYVVMIGTNNFGHFEDEKPEWAAKGVKKIIETIRQRQPQAKILLLAVFPRDDKDSPLRKKVTELNRLIKPLADGKAVVWLDIADAFLDTAGNIRRDIMGDGLHPNNIGYYLWYDRMWPTLQKLLAGG